MTNFRQKIHAFLAWGGRLLKTDMVYLAKGSFWLTLGQIISIIVGFTMAIVFANALLPKTYGTYKYLLSMVGLLGISTLTGMGPMVSRAVAIGKEGSLFEALKSKIRWGTIGGAGSIIFATYYYIHGNIELTLAFLIASIFIPFMDSFQLYQDYLQGKKNFELSVKYFSVSQIIAAVILILAVVFTHNLYAILFAYFVSWTLTRFFFFRRTVKRFPPNSAIDPNTLPYAKNSSLIDAVASVIGSIDQILIFHFIGPVELAIYSFAIAPVTQLTSPFKNISTLAMPKLAERPVSEINRLLKKRMIIAFFTAVIVILTYFLFSPFFYSIFFPKYLSSINLSRVYSLTLLFTVPNTILSAAINAKVTTLPKKRLWLWNIPGIISTLFIFLSIKKIGVVSVAIARILLVAASITIGLIMWRYIVRKEGKQTNFDTPVESLPHIDQE